MTDCCGGVNNITGSNAESSATAGGISGDQIDLGSSVTTSDVDITYTVDDAEWVQGVDYDEAGRPFKLSRTGLGDVVTASSTGQIALPQISGTPSATTFVKVVSGGTLSAADVPGANLSSLSTGVKTGGVLSVASGTTFSITDGTGTVMDDNPLTTGVLTETDVTWTGKTGISVTHIATSLISYVTIDSAGNVQQYTTQPDEEKRREEIYLGVLVHLDMATLTAVNVEVDYTAFPLSQFRDLADTLGFINASGNGLSDNGANLQFNKAVGTMFKIGSNYNIEHHNPNVLTLNSFVSTSGFQYRLQDGTNTAGHTVIDAANYDLSGTLTAVSPSNRFTIQRVFAFVSQNIILQYGQNLYASLAAAEIALLTEPFVTEPSIAANGLLIGYLIVRGNATDLSDASQAVFFDAGKFGSATGAVTIASTLQSAYDNSTTNPEILTNTTNGSVNFRRGSAADTDVVMSVQQNSGTDNFTVTGEGTVNAVAYQTAAAAGKLVTSDGSDNYHATSDNLSNLTSGTANVGIGRTCLSAVTSGTGNVAVGYDSGITVSTGGHNVSVGTNSLKVATGSYNTALGSLSGDTITTGSYNTCIGRNSDVAATLDNQTAIGASAVCDAANQVTIGDTTVTKIRPMADGFASLGDATHQFDQVFVKNDITVSAGDINMTAGDVNMTAGDVIVSSGAVTVDPNNAAGGAITVTNTTTQTSGNLVSIEGYDDQTAVKVSIGDVVVTSGDFGVTGGVSSLGMAKPAANIFPPIMTSNTAPSPYVVTYSSRYSAVFDAFDAFDRGTAQFWVSFTGKYNATTGAYAGAAGKTGITEQGEWIVCDMAVQKTMDSVILTGVSTFTGTPHKFNIIYSTDGTTYSSALRDTSETMSETAETTFNFGSEYTARYWGIQVDEIKGNGSSEDRCGLKKVMFNEVPASLNVTGGCTMTGESLTLSDTNLVMNSTTSALKLPVLTTTERDALDPLEGMVIYNSSTSVLNFYNGSAWGAV